MNSRQKITLGSTAAIVLAAVITWAATGFNILTKQQIPVEQVDELFGTKTIIWKDVFVIGLDIAGPIVAAALLLGGILLYAFRTRTAG